MSRFYSLDPEVAGGLGPGSLIDRSTHPPNVLKLHYEFEGWIGDELVQSFPCFLVSVSLLKRLQDAHLSGFHTGTAEITLSNEFDVRSLTMEFPEFVWLKVNGRAGQDDLGIGPDLKLVASERALRTIMTTNPRVLDVQPIDG